MPEIGTSGSMSGDGKRGVAEWPKLPRPSSTLPEPTWRGVRCDPMVHQPLEQPDRAINHILDQ